MTLPMQDRLGICQWFHYQDYHRARTARTLLRELGVKHLRMDVSWADFHRPQGRDWYHWLFKTLAEFELLVCIWHTPPSISRNGKSNGPPREIEKFAEFVWQCNELYGRHYHSVELWNEPNNYIKWDRTCDPNWEAFAQMINGGAHTAQQQGKEVVLGGMSPIDGRWLDLLHSNAQHMFDAVDVIGIHAFPGQWNEPSETWGGWRGVYDHISEYARGCPIWITETGASAPSLCMEHVQAQRLREVVHTNAARIYWYTLLDLPPDYDEIELHIGGYREPLERTLGIVALDGRKKPAFFALQQLLRE